MTFKMALVNGKWLISITKCDYKLDVSVCSPLFKVKHAEQKARQEMASNL